VLTLLFTKTSNDSKYLVNLIKKSKTKVCYVTLNKSCRSIFAILKKAHVKKDKVYFIDCISARIQTPKPVNNCKYISSPYDFDEIGSSITRAILQGHTFLIFDSLSNLLAYGPAVPAGVDILSRFISRFLPVLNKKNGEAVFVCKSVDKTNLVIAESLQIFNKIKEVK